MARVLGLDIGSDSAVGCLLEEKPADPLEAFREEELKFYSFSATREGIEKLLSLRPQVCVLEPTGKYSRLWRQHLERAGCEVWMVGHKELKKFRENWGTEEKGDELDALALACYWIDFRDRSRRFVAIRHPLAAALRETILRLEHLNRISCPLINNLRQDLSWQFPEAAKKRSEPTSSKPGLLWEWLAEELGERSGTRYDRLFAKSGGLGIEAATRGAARILCQVQREEIFQQERLQSLLRDPIFNPYHEIFDKFGFGERIRGVLLSQLFPFALKFLEEGKPVRIKRKGKKSGKLTTRHISERRFLKCLGVAPVKEQSGTSLNRVRMSGGSDLCRKALWQWLFVRIESSVARPKTEIADRLVAELLEKKASKPVRLARSHVAARAAKLLFRELVKARL